jgi:hypothetical protein
VHDSSTVHGRCGYLISTMLKIPNLISTMLKKVSTPSKLIIAAALVILCFVFLWETPATPPCLPTNKVRKNVREYVERLELCENKVFSQNGEDGILQCLFDDFGTTSKYYVEFGVEDGTECNTRLLREKHGWGGLMMDGSNSDPSINLRKEFILWDNVCSLFSKYNIPKDGALDLLSVDTDFADYWILESIFECSYRPRVLLVEVNASYEPKKAYTVPKPEAGELKMWDQTNFFGATPEAFRKLGRKFGYTMVYCDSRGVNCFLVRDDVLLNVPDIEMLHKPPNFGNHGEHHRDAHRESELTSV